MGSGTVGITCQRLGLPYVGIEVTEAYFEIACERLQATLSASQELPDEA